MPLVNPCCDAANPEIKELSEFFELTLGFPPNSVLTMMHRPEVAHAFTALNRAVMKNKGRLTSEQKRIVGYLVSANNGCRYCQAHTALAAKRFGASAERLSQIWEFRTSDLYSDAERAMFEFALAASCTPSAVTPTIQNQLHDHWDDGEIVEITGVIALFGFLNRWNDTMATELEHPAATAASTYLVGHQHDWEPGKHG